MGIDHAQSLADSGIHTVEGLDRKPSLLNRMKKLDMYLDTGGVVRFGTGE